MRWISCALGVCAVLVCVRCVNAESERQAQPYDALEQLGWSVFEPTDIKRTTLLNQHGDKIEIATALDEQPAGYTLLNFWATWCAPCVVELPQLIALHHEYSAQGVSVLFMNTRESVEVAYQFAQSRQLEFVSFYDTRGALARALAIRGMPVTLLITPQQQVVARYIGLFDWEQQQFLQILDEIASN